LDPAHRLSIEHIKNHEFFDGMIWGRGLWRQPAPRLQPYVPPEEAANIINLNGYSSAAPEPTIPTASGMQTRNSYSGPSRPHPRVITELPPPSQLDIDWSPVLTKSNERILKLGNLNVISGPASTIPDGSGVDGSRKLSRFFGNNHIKKRQRLVMVTSGARIIMAAAGGDEKKSKHEIPLLESSVTGRLSKDSKGGTCWCIETVSTLGQVMTPKC
jgi:3-phosphoinositide dependent protein kinase-1